MFSFNSSSDKRENAALWSIIALHLLAIALPYLWASLIVPADYVWGGLLFNPDDQNVHLAWAKGAAQGHIFSRDYFTTESLSDNSRPLFFNLFTVAVGGLTWLSTLTPVVLAPVTFYHILRVVFAVLGLKWLHELTCQWSDKARVRLTTVALAAFAGGAGWLVDVAPQLMAARTLIDRPDREFPMMPEAFGFPSAFIFPLNTAAIALLCLCYARLLRARKTLESPHTSAFSARRDVAIAAIAAFFIANIHTYDALPLIVIVLLATSIEPRDIRSLESVKNLTTKALNFQQWKTALCVAGAACVPVAYQVLVFAGSEEFRLKALTPTKAPQPFDIALSYGVLGALALVGAYQLIRTREKKTLWPIVWLYCTLLMIYAPVSFSRKMIEGIHVPLCFLAAIAIIALSERVRSASLQRISIAMFIAFLSISSYQFVAWCVGENWRDNNLSRKIFTPPLLLTQGDMGALHYLNALPNERKYLRAVLSLPKLGNYVPQATGFSTYIGHWAETLHLDEKLAQTEAFYNGAMNEAQALQWLRDNKIAYVIEGQYERGIYADSLPSARFNWKPVWTENGTAIYAVP